MQGWDQPKMLVAQSCSTLFDPMDCSPPGSSVHEDSLGKKTGVGSHFLLLGIFPTQGPNPGLPSCRQFPYCLSHQGNLGAKPKSWFTPVPTEKLPFQVDVGMCSQKKSNILSSFSFLFFFPFCVLVLIYRVKTLLNFCAILYLSFLLLSEQITRNLKDTHLSFLCG